MLLQAGVLPAELTASRKAFMQNTTILLPKDQMIGRWQNKIGLQSNMSHCLCAAVYFQSPFRTAIFLLFIGRLKAKLQRKFFQTDNLQNKHNQEKCNTIEINSGPA